MSQAEDAAREALRESMRLNGDLRKSNEREAVMNENGTTQKVINLLVGIVLAVFAWMGNAVWSIIQTQQNQLAQLSIELGKNYMPRVELQQQLDGMRLQLERIDRQTRR